MKIRYVAPIDRTMASHRYRCIIPGQELANMGAEYEISIGLPEKGMVNVYTKHFNRDSMLEGIKETGGVFDVCDDHFNTPELAEYYKQMCLDADVVTCNSTLMAKAIQAEVGRDAIVIDDPYEFPEIEPKIFDLSMGLWFGSKVNLSALKDVELDCDLEVVSGFDAPGRNGHVRQTPWSWRAMEIAFKRNEFAIFPTAGKTRKVEAKSKNRVINAIRGGLLCFCHPTGDYDELDQYCVIGDDLLEEIRKVRDLASVNPTAVMEMVKSGQEYIKERYSPQTLAKKWKGIFDEAQYRVRDQEI